MSSIDSAIYVKLSTFAGLTALVSTRIYPPAKPWSGPGKESTYPLVTFEEVDDVGGHAMGVASSLVDARFQFNCWGETKASARAVARQVKAALDNWNGSSDNVTIKISLYIGGHDMPYDPDEDAYRRIVEFSIQYVEPAA